MRGAGACGVPGTGVLGGLFRGARLAGSEVRFKRVGLEG